MHPLSGQLRPIESPWIEPLDACTELWIEPLDACTELWIENRRTCTEP